MVVKIYISGISGNKEVKKRQQRVLMILDSKNVQYEIIDITEPGKEDEKEFMQANSTSKDSKHPLPPQIFNDEDYCGDYEDFDLANEIDELEKFLKLLSSEDSVNQSLDESKVQNTSIRQNGNTSSREASTDKDVSIANVVSDTEERRNSNTEDKEEDADKSKSSELDGMEENGDKNEEKSDDQEKEE
ncbi:SH3 domain-binding glutamic acid-rich protein homolog [Chelonus insularis]|uniref:SH3 domain-binding glutamic acid-rich protein homolog n=1 Tax=Chelonus insularis TaxID=460826 RepID=UPI001588C6F7|nr:SH3 domain-binding glutamic acid-rich protein homolog [Chelonus insularis]XP_034936067.1 SH3 domain-binding glutamic acid-rich protein homolog [Chelonus insularis]